MSEAKKLTILQLYPKDMNIYGDWGNMLVIKRRAQWHGYEPELLSYDPGDTFPTNVDLIIGGGGQDAGQNTIHHDLLSVGSKLRTLADAGVPMLMVCGLYQLFGHSFTTQDGTEIEGIGLLDVTTKAGNERLIGNVVTDSDEFGAIVGYENHSGQTTLGPHAQAMAQVVRGAGNNGHDDYEGARYKNVIGTYLHGSLLPKNPRIADWLIETAATNRYGEFVPGIIDDHFADLARAVAEKRPR